MADRGLPKFSCAPTRNSCGTRQKYCGGACGPCARFSATRLGGEARRRLALLPVPTVRSHVPSRYVFQKTQLPCPTNYYPNLNSSKRFLNLEPRLRYHEEENQRDELEEEFLVICIDSLRTYIYKN